MNYAEIARATVMFLTPYFTAAGGKLVEDGLSVAREKVVSWLKSKFTKPAQVAALEVASKSPRDADALEALEHHIQRAMDQDEAFRKELLALLPKDALPPGIAQTTVVTGNKTVVVQSTGSGDIRV
jgi:hypothetical protein